MDAIDKIENVLDKLDSEIINSYSYALYSTIDINELCNLYFLYLDNVIVKNKILTHIKSHIKHQNQKLPVRFKVKLLKEFCTSIGKIRKTHGSTIFELSEFLSKKQLNSFFDEQILSNKISDRKRAYNIASKIYSQRITNFLWESWNKYHDELAINVWISYSSSKDVSNVIQLLCQSKYIKRYSLNKAIKIAANFNFESILFLKEKFPIHFLSACVVKNYELEDEYCKKILNDIEDIETFKYFLWCIGMLGKYEFLENSLHILNTIEKKLNITYSF